LTFLESESDLQSRARAQAAILCCKADCLMVAVNHDFSAAVNHLVLCYNELNGMGRKQKKDYLRYFVTFYLKVDFKQALQN
jgi:hypothetical protein